MARAHGVHECKTGERPNNRLELIIYDFTKFTETFAGIPVFIQFFDFFFREKLSLKLA